MLSPLRNRFGIPGLISVIALVFAMLGGAYAASNDGGADASKRRAKKGGLNGATKKLIKKEAKKWGKRFAKTGPAGPAGANGINGADGANGSNGADGANGSNGENGADGKSVALSGSAPLCLEGGVTVEVEGGGSSEEVCNGEAGTPGKNGEEGSPWTAGGTLPVGETETGTWLASQPSRCVEIEGKKGCISYGFLGISTSISFPIPLPSPIAEGQAIYVPLIGANPDPTHCPGSVTAPEAASGYLCVYEGTSSAGNGTVIDTSGFVLGAAGTTGAFLFFFESTGESAASLAYGSWAVTA